MNPFAPPRHDLYGRLILFFEKQTGKYLSMSDLLEEFDDTTEFKIMREIDRLVHHKFIDVDEEIVRIPGHVASTKRIKKWIINSDGHDEAEKVKKRRPFNKTVTFIWAFSGVAAFYLVFVLNVFKFRDETQVEEKKTPIAVTPADKHPLNPNQRVERIIPPDTVYMPRHIGLLLKSGHSSDMDFDTGYGDPTRFQVNVKLNVNRETVKGKIFMSAIELGGDSTSVSGWSDDILLYTNSDTAFYIAQVTPNKPLKYKGETQQKEVIKKRFDNQITKQLKLFIDKVGDEAGIYTRVEVEWDTLSIVLVKKVPVLTSN